MTHVQIRRREDGSASLVVDGHDLSMVVAAAGLEVHSHEDYAQPWLVKCVIPADVLDVDLPGVLFAASRADAEPEAEAS